MNPVQRLSSDQLAQFERDGFLHVPGVLSPDQVEKYLAVVEELAASFRQEKELEPDATVEIRNAVARDERLLELMTLPLALGAMLDILGYNIQLSTSHVFVRPSTPREGAKFKAIDWHADGPSPRPLRVGETEPRLYAKIGLFLTDLSQPDMGNLRVIPGSHLRADCPPRDENGEPQGAIQVLTKPGDAVFFENRCWHAVGPNYAPHARRNIYFGYCPRWMKAIDFVTQSPELLEKANPIQKQLLGAATHELSYFLPSRAPGDVPLKEWA